MAKYDALAALPNGEPGPWGDPVEIAYDKRDVLLYAVGIGIRDLGFVYEGHPGFSVFPTFPIRWGGAGAPSDRFGSTSTATPARSKSSWPPEMPRYRRTSRCSAFGHPKPRTKRWSKSVAVSAA